MKIYIVATSGFDGSDDNLYQNARAFQDEDKAREYFKHERESCKDDAMGIYEDGDKACYNIKANEFDDFADYWRTDGATAFMWHVEIYPCTI